ncbi:hypothetical protein DERP_009963 [Dermatophagoides pteronyssinus]|uniref:Uncharacterized protein n=1 Tax=Dermatophagoides pteronyssinus TaxID=6956 RepID=A0ABQ8J204_DERPT|nr:hypothetical protein DERP_009963 [Dermatophagoides pteronyssinus]
MLKIITLFIILSTINDSHQQFGLFDSVNDLINVYDGMDCSIKIIDIYFQQFQQPICCIYWKFRKFFENKANDYCEQPQNVQKILSGKILKDYVDFKHLDCRNFLENSPECSRFWSILFTIFFGQFLFLSLFSTTTIILIWKLCRKRQQQPRVKSLINSRRKLSRCSSEASSLLTTSTIIANTSDTSSDFNDDDDDGDVEDGDDDFFSCHHHLSMMSLTGHSI